MNTAATLMSLCAISVTASPQEAAPALRGLDPVGLCSGEEVHGKSDFKLSYGRHLYSFVSEATRAQFIADPERYAIQWGGACGRMGPLSGRGDVDRFAVHAGRIYVFASDGCRDGFVEDPERFVPPSQPVVVADPVHQEVCRTWLNKAVAAHGGADVIDGLAELRFTGERETGGWKNEHGLLVNSKGDVRRRSRWKSPNEDDAPVETTWVNAGGRAFTVESGEVFDLRSEPERNDVRRFAWRELMTLFWLRGRGDLDCGPGVLAGASTMDVVLRNQGLATTLHIDQESGRVGGISWRGRLVSAETTRDAFEQPTRAGG